MNAGRIRTNNLSSELPFGYKFHPTPFEVLQYYLAPKLRGEDLPSGYIKDLDVYQYDDPHQIPLNESKYTRDNESYFFVPDSRELQRVDKLTRRTLNGYWKILERNVPVYGPNGDTIGHKNKLEFYEGKDPDGVITNWKMVEYRIGFGVDGKDVDRLMVCKIKLKVEEEEIYEEEMSYAEEMS